MARPTYDITLCYAESQRPLAEALHDALAPHAKVWSASRSLRVGEPVSAVVRAVEQAGMVVLLVAGGDDLDHALGDAVARAITAARSDPRRAVVPVYVDERGASHPLYGTAILQGCNLHRDGQDKVVAALRTRVSALRTVWNARPRVALVAVLPEMTDVVAAVEARLRPMAHTLECLDASDLQATERAREADLRVLLVGGRTGGTTVLHDLLAGGAVALKRATLGLDSIPEEEFPAVKQLHARIASADSFASVDEAVGRAQDHFAQWLSAWAVTTPGGTTALEPWERTYLEAQRQRWAIGTHETLRDAKNGRPIPRDALYVPLRGRRMPTAWEDAEGNLVVNLRAKDSADDARTEPREAGSIARLLEELASELARHDPWLEALLSHRGLPAVVLEGEAGAGKTVLLQHVACVLTSVHLAQQPVPHRLDLAALAEGAPRLRVPVLVEARRIAPWLQEGNVGELIAALCGELNGHAPGAVTEQALRDGMEAGRFLLLVDSLDEVPGIEARERVVRALDNLANLRWPLRIVLTTRPTAHTGITLGAHLTLLQLAPMDDDRVVALIDRWATVMGQDEDYRTRVRSAVQGVRDRQGGDPKRGESLTANPLLLTCALLVYDQQRVLPDALATLYERMVGILCRAKETRPAGAKQPYTAEFKRQLLQRVCEAMQRQGSTAHEVREAARRVLEKDPQLATLTAATAVLDQLGADTGLLRFETLRDTKTGRTRRVVRPWHRSFQEFLCACAIADGNRTVQDETDALIDGPGQVAFDPAWENTLGFLVGVYGDRSTEKARGYVERLLARGRQGGASVRRGRLLGLAAHGVVEYAELFRDDRLHVAVRDAIATRFVQEGASWPLTDRLLALEGLGRLGDPRLREDHDLWVEIPAGVLVTGDRTAHSPLPPGRVVVPAFAMAWRPVTVADYRPFVDEGASRDPAVWGDTAEDERHPKPEDWEAQCFHPSRPVVGVSYFEAKAWCRWASARWRKTIDLPTEVEWEFAARGRESNVYPWGRADPGTGAEARANYDHLVGSPSPVGAFTTGNRGRLVDLAGNVWEWTDSLWDDGDEASVEPTTGEEPRVARGGSWASRTRVIRCATRNWNHPRNRSRYLGFRVVVRVSRQHA